VLEGAPAGARRFDLSDRALTIARAAADRATLARVLLLRTMTIAAPDTLSERIANCEELLALANDLGDPAISFQAAWARSPTAVESGDARAVDEMVRVASEVAEDLGQPVLRWQASFMRSARLILRGRLDEAEQLATETRALGERANQQMESEIFYNEQLLEIRRWQDRLPEVIGALRELAGVEGIDFGYALTRYLYDAGEHEEAADRYRSVVEHFVLPPRRDLLAGPVLCNLGYLAARLGDQDRMPELFDALLPLASSFANTTVAKPVGAHFLGMLASARGEDDEAERYFVAAAAAHAAAETPLLRAETLLEHARLAARTGARARRDTLLGAAREIASQHGALMIVRGCAELASAG
jgi:tetratricopeptide (TPR) repeat protein